MIVNHLSNLQKVQSDSCMSKNSLITQMDSVFSYIAVQTVKCWCSLKS